MQQNDSFFFLKRTITGKEKYICFLLQCGAENAQGKTNIRSSSEETDAIFLFRLEKHRLKNQTIILEKFYSKFNHLKNSNR